MGIDESALLAETERHRKDKLRDIAASLRRELANELRRHQSESSRLTRQIMEIERVCKHEPPADSANERYPNCAICGGVFFNERLGGIV